MSKKKRDIVVGSFRVSSSDLGLLVKFFALENSVGLRSGFLVQKAIDKLVDVIKENYTEFRNINPNVHGVQFLLKTHVPNSFDLITISNTTNK